ncbi:MAG: HAD family hydrolase [Bacteroidales bacterium]|nr:HAD family hydrolase [Bacteroidales bacterium]
MSSRLSDLTPFIIWDWNGTLLNDLAISVKAMNRMLQARQLPALSSDNYREIFRFPVRDYYQDIGFDFKQEAFEIPALEFMQHYQNLLHEAVLFEGVRETLEQLRAAGYKQFVLSAMEQQLLDQLLEQHQISSYFEHIQGIDDHFADGKIMAAHKLIAVIGNSRPTPIMVGDTLHDAEVGAECGFETILFSGGHFSAERLKQAGLSLFENHKDLQEFLLKNS